VEGPGRGQRYTDGMKISFPLPYIAAIVAAFLAIAGSMWALRSDVRDILTRMELQSKLQEERSNAMRESLESMKRRQELQQYEIQGLREAINSMQEGRKR
jgi:hypothetical protein